MPLLISGVEGLGGIAKGLALDDGGLCVRRTIVKAGGLGDATQAYALNALENHKHVLCPLGCQAERSEPLSLLFLIYDLQLVFVRR
jgi:hypothetical protein